MEKDLELYNQWKRTQNPQDLEKLLKQLDPLIQAEVNRRSGTLARPLLEAQAKVLTVRAIKSYNPNFGAKLSTHVTNQLQKLSRANYAHQNALRIPEHSMTQAQSYRIAIEDFNNEHGRDPTTEELSDTLKWSPRRVEEFRKNYGRKELLESRESPTEMFVPYAHDPRIDYAYHSMSPRQQFIFEHSTGYQNAKKLSNADIMRQLNITQGVLSYEKNKIKSLLQQSQR